MNPTVTVEEKQDGTRVLVKVGDAQVWVRATPGGRRLDVWIDEGNGSVDVEWGVRRWSDLHPPEVAPGYIQSPHRGQR